MHRIKLGCAILSMLALLLSCSSKKEEKAVEKALGELAMSHSRILLRPEASVTMSLTNVGSGALEIIEVTTQSDNIELDASPHKLNPQKQMKVEISALDAGDATIKVRFHDGNVEQVRRVVVQSRKVNAESCVSKNPCVEAFIDDKGECEHRTKKGKCDDKKSVTYDDRCTDGICIGRARKGQVFAPGYDTAENVRGAMDDLARRLPSD